MSGLMKAFRIETHVVTFEKKDPMDVQNGSFIMTRKLVDRDEITEVRPKMPGRI